MSILHRAFISYSHQDNEARTVEERGIIKIIHDDLESNLSTKHTGRNGNYSIYTDDELQGGYGWEAQLQENVSKSGVLLCILTISYLQSEYCLKEFDYFWQERENRVKNHLVGDNWYGLFFINLWNNSDKEFKKAPFLQTNASDAYEKLLQSQAGFFRGVDFSTVQFKKNLVYRQGIAALASAIFNVTKDIM